MLDDGALRLIDRWVARLIEARYSAKDALLCRVAVGYSAFSSSIAFFLMKGSAGLICPTDICSSTALSGISKVCVGRLWQSMQSISRFSPFSSSLSEPCYPSRETPWSSLCRPCNKREELPAVAHRSRYMNSRAIIQMAAMNSHRALPSAATYVDKENCSLRRVFLVIRVIRFCDKLVARKALGPVAMFIRVARRTEVFHGGRNWARISVERYRSKLHSLQTRIGPNLQYKFEAVEITRTAIQLQRSVPWPMHPRRLLGSRRWRLWRRRRARPNPREAQETLGKLQRQRGSVW